MIQRNPIIRSIATVFLFWYIGLFLVAGFLGIPIYEVPRYLGVSTAVILLGGVIGALGTLSLRTLFSQVTEVTIREGGRFREMDVALGRMPALPRVARARLPKGYLDRLPWWPAMASGFPVHAAAIRAVLEVMHTRPSLPASPIPGGHGGRTLIEHSMAVAAEIIPQAKTWLYEGQRDKRGRIRTRLNGPPHRFASSDAGLLVLTGLAHDIGKLVCFEDGGVDPHGRALVREVNGNHDTEGARLLRSLPEIMALPFADRTALLVAVGYYHHPFAMPRAGWLTDRMRSLTELLIKADIETGRKEGHSLVQPDEDTEDDDGDAPYVAREMPVDPPGEDEEDDVGAAVMGALARKQEKKARLADTPPGPARRTAPTQEDNDEDEATNDRARGLQSHSARDEQFPFELDLLIRMLSRDGAINGRDRNRRIAWKFGDRIYVMDQPLRREALQFANIPNSARDDFETETGNATAFTRRLLEQLDQRGWLIRVFDGHVYVPARAVFYAINAGGTDKGGTPVPVFIVKTAAVPVSRSIPNAQPMLVTRSLWDPKTKDNWKGMKEGGTSVQSHAGDSPVPPVAAPSTTTVDTVDHPFGDLVSPPTSTTDLVGAETPTTDPTTESAPPSDRDIKDALCSALLSMVTGPEWPWPVETRPLESGLVRVMVPADGDAGRAIAAVITAYEASGIQTTGVRLVRRKSDDTMVYAWESPVSRTTEVKAA